jgi:hypothetical protein
VSKRPCPQINCRARPRHARTRQQPTVNSGSSTEYTRVAQGAKCPSRQQSAVATNGSTTMQARRVDTHVGTNHVAPRKCNTDNASKLPNAWISNQTTSTCMIPCINYYYGVHLPHPRTSVTNSTLVIGWKRQVSSPAVLSENPRRTDQTLSLCLGSGSLSKQPGPQPAWLPEAISKRQGLESTLPGRVSKQNPCSRKKPNNCIIKCTEYIVLLCTPYCR